MAMSRKAADELDRRLSEARSGTRPASAADDEIAALVETAMRLQALSPVRRSAAPADQAGPAGTEHPPRAQFRADLRRRLDAEARSLAPARSAASAARARPGVVVGAAPAPRRRRSLVLAGLVASAVALGTATSVASSAALPGDLLYPVKRSAEGARLFVPRSEASRGAAELDLARERLGESWRLAASGTEPDPAALEAVLAELRSTAGGGVSVLLTDFEDRGDPAALAEVQQFLVTAIPSMRDLSALLPPALRPVAQELVAQWQGARESVADAVRTCGPPCEGVLD